MFLLTVFPHFPVESRVHIGGVRPHFVQTVAASSACVQKIPSQSLSSVQ